MYFHWIFTLYYTRCTNAVTDPYIINLEHPYTGPKTACLTQHMREAYIYNDAKTGNDIFIGITGIFDAQDGLDDTCNYVFDMMIAVNEINASVKFLPNNNLKVIIKDDKNNVFNGFLRGMEFCGINWGGEATIDPAQNHWNSFVKRVDAVVGPMFSGQTKNMASILQHFDIPNMSQSATNPGLSVDADYKFMHRVVSEDNSQGAAVIALCDHFGWSKLAVAHTTLPYATGFANAIKSASENYLNVAVTTVVSWVTKDDSSKLIPQVQILRDSRVKVIMCTSHNVDCLNLLEAANHPSIGIYGSPYLWLFGDSGGTASKTMTGSIQIAPYSPSSGDIFTHFTEIRNNWEVDGKTKGWSTTSFSYYSYDAVWALGRAFDIFYKGIEECGGGNNDLYITNHNVTLTELCKYFIPDSFPSYYSLTQGEMIRWILRNMVSFEGSSGFVSFADNGDRQTSAWSIFNCPEKNRDCLKVGEIIENEDVAFYDNYDQLRWPGGTTRVPLAWPVETELWKQITPSAHLAVIILIIVTWLFAGSCVSVSFYYRHKAIMRMSSYKINALTVTGVCLCVTSVYWFIQDEGGFPAHERDASTLSKLDINCIVFPVVLLIGFALYFGSMGAKLWRVKQIFKEEQALRKMQIADMDLLGIVFVYVFCQICLLILWMVLAKPSRKMNIIFEGKPNPKNEMELLNEYYGSCSSPTSIYSFVVLAFNGLVVIVVATWAFEMRNVFYKAVNDSVQIAHIIILLSLICFFLVPLSFSLPLPTELFKFMFAGIIIIAWASIALIYAAKFYAIFMGTEDSWTMSNTMVGSVGNPSRITSGSSIVPVSAADPSD